MEQVKIEILIAHSTYHFADLYNQVSSFKTPKQAEFSSLEIKLKLMGNMYRGEGKTAIFCDKELRAKS